MSALLLSVSMDRWLDHHQAFLAWRATHTDPPFLGVEVPSAVRDAAGMLLVIDRSSGAVLGRRRLPMPQGACFEGERLWVTLRGPSAIAALDGHGERRWARPWLMNPHTLAPCGPGRWLLTSSGTDTIAEVDAWGAVHWRWRAWEHGLGVRPDGAPYRFDPTRDHGDYVGVAADHAVHPNSALPDGDHVLATFFHQGVIARIDRRTGGWTVALDGLDRPHALRRAPWGYTVADSQRGRVLRLDRRLQVIGVHAGLDWVQDAAWVPGPGGGSLYILSNRHIAAAHDTRHNTLLELDAETGECRAEHTFPAQYHLYAVESVPDGWLSSPTFHRCFQSNAHNIAPQELSP